MVPVSLSEKKSASGNRRLGYHKVIAVVCYHTGHKVSKLQCQVT